MLQFAALSALLCCMNVSKHCAWLTAQALNALDVQVRREGWLPQHVIVRSSDTQEMLACCPLYLKTHSSGRSQSRQKLTSQRRWCLSQRLCTNKVGRSELTAPA